MARLDIVHPKNPSSGRVGDAFATATFALLQANGGTDGDTIDTDNISISFDPEDPGSGPAYADGGLINFHAQEGGTSFEDGMTPGCEAGVHWQIVGPNG